MLGDRKGNGVMVYVVDASIGTETEEDHMILLQCVLRTLFKAGVRLKLSKCRFGVRRFEMLGHEVGPEGVRPSANHLKALHSMVEPARGDALTRFLGLEHFFARFIDHFAIWT